MKVYDIISLDEGLKSKIADLFKKKPPSPNAPKPPKAEPEPVIPSGQAAWETLRAMNTVLTTLGIIQPVYETVWKLSEGKRIYESGKDPSWTKEAYESYVQKTLADGVAKLSGLLAAKFMIRTAAAGLLGAIPLMSPKALAVAFTGLNATAQSAFVGWFLAYPGASDIVAKYIIGLATEKVWYDHVGGWVKTAYDHMKAALGGDPAVVTAPPQGTNPDGTPVDPLIGPVSGKAFNPKDYDTYTGKRLK